MSSWDDFKKVAQETVGKAPGAGQYVHVHRDSAFELIAERDALLAERDARLLQIDTLAEWYSNSLDVINEITAALPGAHYMDPPDGGDVSVPEQVRRMAKDAERYRWLLRQAWFQSAFDRYDFDDGGMQHRFERCAAEIIDAALQGAQP